MLRFAVKELLLDGFARRGRGSTRRRFTPCARVGSLLEATERTAESAVPEDVVLLSPAGSGRHRFQHHDDCGGTLRDAVWHGPEGNCERSGGPPTRDREFGRRILERLKE